jgi:osmotically-inducible protein OsmY
MIRSLGRLFWIGVGAIGAYLFDPVSGRSRRARLQDQLAAQVRDVRDEAVKKTRYEAGRVKGRLYEAARSETPPATDAELLQKVRSEAIGRVPGSTDHIDVRVDDGVVILEGESRDHSQERELMTRIGNVTGVREVRNQLVEA